MAEAGSRRLRGLRSIRVRTTAAAVLVVAVALAIGGAALVVALRQSLTDQIRTAARLRAEDVVGVIEAGTAPSALAVDDDEDLVIQVIDAEGRVVVSSANAAGEQPLADLAPGRSTEVDDTPIGDGASFVLVAERADSGSGTYTVLVGRSAETVGEATATVTSLLVVGLPILVSVVGATTWFVAGRTLAPVEAMRLEVDEITSAALDRRVPDPGTDDEVARLAGTMNDMLDRLERSQGRQRRFVSDASHELRSPVATIRQHAEVALAHPEQSSVAALAEVVLAEDLRLQDLVADLILLARLDEGVLATGAVDVDVDDLALDEAGRLRAMVPGVRVDATGVGGGRVRGDAGQLARVLRNLGDNARRHARAAIRISVHESGDRVVVRVEDDGDGVPEDAREAVFDRFVRLDEARARDRGGSGLGLAVVREIVGAHGGSCRMLASDLGGAAVEVVLPSAG
ncbi:MAG: HAMP domain-containing protein [Acidimicrobiales bacterium]|nr:HAMP domain-containing protein [Acidimicrobiales bacterium]